MSKKKEDEEDLKWLRTLALLVFTAGNAYLSYQLRSTFGELEEERSEWINLLNVTVNSNENVVFFNRVPKAGSTSFAFTMQDLSKRNGFDFYSFRIGQDGTDFEVGGMSDAEQNDTAHYMTNSCSSHNSNNSDNNNNTSSSCGYYKHMFFIDFEKYGLRNPVYVNLVRHPVDRLQSWYYYVRSTYYIVGVSDTMSVGRLKGSLDDCIMGRWQCDINMESANANGSVAWLASLVGKEETDWLGRLSKLDVSKIVTGPKRYSMEERGDIPQGDEVSSQVKYFCGYGHRCNEQPENALNRLRIAMDNVDRHYAVVGVLEDMDMSLAVFENMVPKYFAGVRDIKRKVVNTNKPKPELSPEARALLEDYLHYEIVFYEFCRQRLHRQYQAVM